MVVQRIQWLPFLFALLFLVAACSNNHKEPSTTTTSTPPANTISNGQTAAKTIVFFGNSLTAGYGLEPAQAFPNLIQQKLDSMNLPYKVVNAGVSGETSAGGAGRIDWILKQPVDVFVLELGANDGLRGIPVAETKKNLQSIIDKVRAKYPNAKIVLAGMQVPPNMGRQYATDFRQMFPDLAQKNNAALIPFLLEGVGGEAHLNLEDGIHPTAEGHQILAQNVWSVLQKELE